MSVIITTKEWLSSQFEVKDMGEANYILGVKIVRGRSKKLLCLSQETYIKKVLERFHMGNSKSIDAPIDKPFQFTLDHFPKNEEEMGQISNLPYAYVVWSLKYAFKHLLRSGSS